MTPKVCLQPGERLRKNCVRGLSRLGSEGAEVATATRETGAASDRPRSSRSLGAGVIARRPLLRP
jgi:hypothetical protein